jgi:hypothetical protein
MTLNPDRAQVAALGELSESEREDFEERAAICEYCGGQSRAQAERTARERVEARRLREREKER